MSTFLLLKISGSNYLTRNEQHDANYHSFRSRVLITLMTHILCKVIICLSVITTLKIYDTILIEVKLKFSV